MKLESHRVVQAGSTLDTVATGTVDAMRALCRIRQQTNIELNMAQVQSHESDWSSSNQTAVAHGFAPQNPRSSVL